MVDENCVVCKGSGTIELLGSQCPFCNGTGDFTKAAESYLHSHICQCIFLDRKKCPLCGKNCHHDTPNKPKVLIGPVWKFYSIGGSSLFLSCPPEPNLQ